MFDKYKLNCAIKTINNKKSSEITYVCSTEQCGESEQYSDVAPAAAIAVTPADTEEETPAVRSEEDNKNSNLMVQRMLTIEKKIRRVVDADGVPNTVALNVPDLASKYQELLL